MRAATMTSLGGTAVLSLLALLSVLDPARADCLVGDILIPAGETTGGHIGLECVNSTSYEGSATACGPDGELEEAVVVFTCPESVPYCVQCGPRGWGAALCLSTPDVGNRDCGDDDNAGGDPTTVAPDGGFGGWTDMTPGVQNDPGMPQSTAPVVTIGLFDQCDNEADVAVWTSYGGEAARPDHAQYCRWEYDGGCLNDGACVARCQRETYGYSAECAACFGNVPACNADRGCEGICAADNQGPECQECMAACIEELNECTGLPRVDASASTDPVGGCTDGREGVDDPTCTLTLREQTCEGQGFDEADCLALSCCQWDPAVALCNAACVIPDDGEACCGLVEEMDTPAPVASPSATTPATESPIMLPGGGSVPAPTYAPTATPVAPAPAPGPDNSREGPSSGASSSEVGQLLLASAVGLLALLMV